MQAKSKSFVLALSLIVILLSLSIFFMRTKDVYTAECRSDERASCITAGGYTGFRACENGFYSKECFIANLDDCSIRQGQLSNICCKAKDGNVYDCNEKIIFTSGEYVIVKVNLQYAMEAAGLNLDFYKTYKACAFSKLISAESEIPERYLNKTSFYTDEIGCSQIFYSKDFRQTSIDGFIPKTSGLVNLAEVRIYPVTIELADSKDAQEKISLSTSVFSFKVNVSE